MAEPAKFVTDNPRIGLLKCTTVLAGLLLTSVLTTGCSSSDGNQQTQPTTTESSVRVSPETAQLVELKHEAIARRKLQSVLRVTGQIKPDVGKEVNVNARFVGRVHALLVTLGQKVQPGYILARVESQEVTAMQAELIESKSKLRIAEAHEEAERQIYEERLKRPEALIQAQSDYENAKAQLEVTEADYIRIEHLRTEKIASLKDLLQTKANLAKAKASYTEATNDLQREQHLYTDKALLRRDYQQAKAETVREKQHLEILRQRLITLGLAPAMVQHLLDTGTVIGIVPIVAPASGIVSHVGVAVGEVIDPSKHAFTITDLSSVVVSADIPEADLHKVKIGTIANVKLASDPKHPIHTTIDYIGPHVDPHTRTVAIRAHLNNSDGTLKHNMFAEIEIATDPVELVACPKSAIQERDGQKVVYVLEGDQYKERPIRVGNETEDYCEVLSGVTPGDTVATQGSLMLRTKLTYQH
jgi:membrane fusion protein, heavy metal efflux system